MKKPSPKPASLKVTPDNIDSLLAYYQDERRSLVSREMAEEEGDGYLYGTLTGKIDILKQVKEMLKGKP